MVRTKPLCTTSSYPVTINKSKGRIRKRRRYRPGTQVLRQIRKYQVSTELLIRKLPFQRLVREIVHNECTSRGLNHIKKIQSTALLALQTVVEDYCVELLSQSQLAAIHRGRITIEPRDLQLVRVFRRENTSI